MSALPKAVQKQVAEANRLAEEIKKGRSAPAETPPAPPTEAAALPPAPATPPAPEPPETPPSVIVTPPGTPPSEEAWEKKYRTLQGKYNAEVPRLQTQVREMTTQMQNLQSQLTTTQALLTANRQSSLPSAAAPPPPAPGTKLVKDEEVKTFGADLYDFVRRTAQETLLPELDKFRPAMQQVGQVVQQVQQVQKQVAMTDQQRLLALLTDQVPDWERLNDDAEFLTWLNQVDPYSGATRQQLLDEAFNRNDGPRVVAFFKGFQNEHAAVTPPAVPTPAPQPAPAAPAPAAIPRSLEQLVAPGTSKSGAVGAPNEAQKRVFTAAEINEFTNKRNRYVVSGRKVPDELVALEREILVAAREGRVRP